MNFAINFKKLWRNQPGSDGNDCDAYMADGRRKGEADNPYLSARRTWNDHLSGLRAARQNWQILAMLALLVALAGVGGIVHIGSQSRFIPYVIAVDKLGQAAAMEPASKAAPADQRVVQASVAAFITDARLVTPDIALQRKAIFRIYAMLSANDAATAKTNEWLNGTENSSPFKRAEKLTVNSEIVSVLPQTEDTWQVEWIETERDRQGILKDKPFRMRALITVYTLPPTAETKEEQIRNNPLGIYVRDYSWSRQL